MSISDANPKRYEYIRNLEDKRKGEMCSILNQKRLLFRELAGACSCDECGKQIEKLKKFETDVIFLSDLNSNYYNVVHRKERILSRLNIASKWTIRTLILLQKKLEAICKSRKLDYKLEKSPSLSKMEDLDRQIADLLIRNGIIHEPQEDERLRVVEIEMDDNQFICGKHWYHLAQASEETLALIHKLQMIQEMPEVDVKKKIEDQFQLRKELPFEEMHLQAKNMVKESCPLKEKINMFQKTREFFMETCVGMNMIVKNEFRSTFPEILIKEHSFNGVDRVLQSLVNKEGWKVYQYAPFFNPSLTSLDRFDPKRQKIEQLL